MLKFILSSILFQLLEIVHVITLSIVIIVSIVKYCQRTKAIVSTFHFIERLSLSIGTSSKILQFMQIFEMTTIINKIECKHYDALQSEARGFLQSFYLQLNHQPVTFNLFGFRSIDMTLLASIATGIISNLIILVQFYGS